MIRFAWLAGILACQIAIGQVKSGVQVLTFASPLDNAEQPYALYLPSDFNAATTYPLIIALHGTTTSYSTSLRRIFGQGLRPAELEMESLRRTAKLPDLEFAVAAPFARGIESYQGIAEIDVYAAIADVERRVRIDKDRVYLTGTDEGAGGALWLAANRPDFWAAVSVITPVLPARTDALLPNLLNVPVALFQGAADPVVPVEATRALRTNLERAGVKTEYQEYAAVAHNSWALAYRGGAVARAFQPIKRNAWPERVVLKALSYRNRSAYWIRIDKLQQGAAASVEARIAPGNRITVTTAGIDGFTIRTEGNPLLVPTRPVRLAVDGTEFVTRAARPIAVSRAAGKWVMRPAVFAAGEKKPGADGPASEAIASRHVYVYGTMDAPTPPEALRRQAVADAAATWSAPKHPVNAEFRVLADAEVTDADLQTGNLILFGTRETNSVIARLAPRLPLELSASAADYGLVYIWPTSPGHYALINSGLPWWTQADQATSRGLRPIPVPYTILNTFEDFILFKGGLDHVVTEGYFDSNWRLPTQARQAMAATGAVAIR